MSAARVVIVGAGFAGFTAARDLQKYAPHADIVLINPTDYFLYLPLPPEVGAITSPGSLSWPRRPPTPTNGTRGAPSSSSGPVGPRARRNGWPVG
jgi:NADH dehydrogenase FAD-containing subunit